MSGIAAKLKREIRSIAIVTLYFALWLATLMLIKVLLLAEYEIKFDRWSAAIVGALILAKVVLVLERVPLGPWVESRAAWIGVLLRTALYTLGVAAVLAIEHGVSGRKEHGGFLPALAAAARVTDSPHVAVNVICVSGALLVYNAFDVMYRGLGADALRRLFLDPAPPRR